jgi:hypothetical protein
MKLQVVRIGGKNRQSIFPFVMLYTSWHFRTLQRQSKEVIMAESIAKRRMNECCCAVDDAYGICRKLLDPPSRGGTVRSFKRDSVFRLRALEKFEKKTMSLVALDDPSEKPTVIDHVPPWSGQILFVTDKS